MVGVFYHKDIYIKMRELIRNILREHTTKFIVESSKLSQDEFINRAKKVHGDKYDYSDVEYVTGKTPVKINCPIHGQFSQRPAGHLEGQGCKICSFEQMAQDNSLSKDQFIERSKKVHGDKFDYSKVDYTKGSDKVTIICPIHGEFQQRAKDHMGGLGCDKCSGRSRGDTESFIEKAKQLHGDKYDYSKVNYVNNRTKVEIICKKHGPFMQTPTNHLSNQGCPTCLESKGEKFVAEILTNNNIAFEREFEFDDCIGITSKFCKKLPFDFYIPKYNTCIEYDGRQHFEPVYGQENLEAQKVRDRLKDEYCKENGIKLIRIPYTIKMSEVESYLLQQLG
jgi:hypothetical protein